MIRQIYIYIKKRTPESSGNDLRKKKKKKTEPQVRVCPFQTQTFRPLIRVFKIKRRLSSSNLNIFHSSEKSGDLQSAHCFRKQFSQLDFCIFFVSKLVYFKGWVGSGHMVKKIRLYCRVPGFDPWVGKIPWRREWLLTPVLLLGESHGQEEPGRLQSMGSHRVRHD